MFKSPEFKVGITVLTAIILLIAGIMWGTGFRFKSEVTPLSVYYNNVYGIGADSPVTIGGLRQGIVTEVRLYQGKVYIDLELDGIVALPTDSRIFVKSDGLMGGRFMAIELGTAQTMLNLSQPLAGNIESSITDMVGAMGGIMAKLEHAIDGLDRVLGNEQLEASLVRSLAHVEKTAASLAHLVGSNRGKITGVIDDFSRTSKVLGSVVGDRGEDLGKAVDNFVHVSGQAKSAMERMDDITVSFKTIAEQIENNEGSLGKMLNSDELYKHLVGSIAQLDSLIADVKKNPMKYTKGLKLELF